MASTFWVNSGVDWMMPASHILRYGIDPWVLSCISMFLLTLRSLSGSYGPEATFIEGDPKKTCPHVWNEKKQKKLLDLLWLLQGLNISPISSNLEKIHWFWPPKNTPGHPSPTQPFLRQPSAWKEPQIDENMILELLTWPLVDLLAPAKIIASFQWRHWKVRFSIGGVFPLCQKMHQKIYLPTVNQGSACPPEGWWIWGRCFLYLYTDSRFCQKTDVSQKS